MLTLTIAPEIESRFHFLAKEIKEEERILLQKSFYRLMEDLEDIYEANEVLKNYDPKESIIWTLEDIKKERAKLNVAR